MNLSILYNKLAQIKPRTYLISIFICCLPAFFANIQNKQDWGDDYAQYLSQADALLHGRTSVKNGYIYQDFAKGMGPAAYPPGFPILLSIPLALFGYDVSAILIFISLLAMLWFIGISKLFKNKITLFSLGAILFFTFYNLEFLQFKAEILSEIPFAACTFFALYFLEKAWDENNWKIWILAILLCSFSILLRSLGWLLLPAFIIQALRLVKLKKILIPTLAISFGTVLLYFLLAKILFHTDSENSYAGQFDFSNEEIILLHLKINPLLWATAFTGSHELLSRPFYLVSAWVVISCVYKWIKKPSIFDIYFLAYLAVMMLWPHTAIRFFIPVFPLYLFYVSWGIEQFIQQLKAPKTVKIAIAISFVLIFIVKTSTQFPRVKEFTFTETPFTPEAQEIFSYIERETPLNSGFVFIKPRLLSWEAKRKTMITNIRLSHAENEEVMDRYGVGYVLLFRKGFPYQEGFEQLVFNNPHFYIVKENDLFILYKKQP